VHSAPQYWIIDCFERIMMLNLDRPEGSLIDSGSYWPVARRLARDAASLRVKRNPPRSPSEGDPR